MNEKRATKLSVKNPLKHIVHKGFNELDIASRRQLSNFLIQDYEN